MKYAIGVLLFGMLLISMPGCSVERPGPTDDVRVDDLQRLALSGDPLAAAAMQLRFAKTDPDETLYWTRIAAENGHTVSQYNLAFEYWAHGAGSERDKIRAKFWLGKAAEGGDALAAAKLERLNVGEPW